jgi:hypothetical protein
VASIEYYTKACGIISNQPIGNAKAVILHAWRHLDIALRQDIDEPDTDDIDVQYLFDYSNVNRQIGTISSLNGIRHRVYERPLIPVSRPCVSQRSDPSRTSSIPDPGYLNLNTMPTGTN